MGRTILMAVVGLGLGVLLGTAGGSGDDAGGSRARTPRAEVPSPAGRPDSPVSSQPETAVAAEDAGRSAEAPPTAVAAGASALEVLRGARARPDCAGVAFAEFVERIGEQAGVRIVLDAEAAARMEDPRHVVHLMVLSPTSALKVLRLVCGMKGLEVHDGGDHVLVRNKADGESAEREEGR